MVTQKDATVINEEFLCLSKYVSIQFKVIKKQYTFMDHFLQRFLNNLFRIKDDRNRIKVKDD